jgi:Tfp pilus assembly protein PilV
VRSGERGYTILEALVAFAILSTVLMALYAAAGNTLQATERSLELRRVAMLAHSKLEELQAVPRPLPSTQFGLFPGTRIAWELHATDLGSAIPGYTAVRLQNVILELSWTDAAGRQTWSVHTRHLGIVHR